MQKPCTPSISQAAGCVPILADYVAGAMCTAVAGAETRGPDGATTGRAKASERARLSLLGVNFFVETNRLEPLVAVYLISFKGWQETHVGYVSLVMNLLMLLLQTPAGDLLDKMPYKRAVTAGATLVASITTMAVAWTSELWAIIIIKALEGAAATIFLPSLMSLLLAVVPDAAVPKMVALTETSNKIGSALFTVATGFMSYYLYPNVAHVFYLLGGGGVVAAVFVMLIPPTQIDGDRARQLTKAERKERRSREGAELSLPSKERRSKEELEEEPKASPSRYRDLFRNRDIVMFALLTFLYHLSNAGVVPLAMQLAALQNQRTGLALTSAGLCIFYCVQAPTAYVIGLVYKRFGYKNSARC